MDGLKLMTTADHEGLRYILEMIRIQIPLISYVSEQVNHSEKPLLSCSLLFLSAPYLLDLLGNLLLKELEKFVNTCSMRLTNRLTIRALTITSIKKPSPGHVSSWSILLTRKLLIHSGLGWRAFFFCVFVVPLSNFKKCSC